MSSKMYLDRNGVAQQAGPRPTKADEKRWREEARKHREEYVATLTPAQKWVFATINKHHPAPYAQGRTMLQHAFIVRCIDKHMPTPKAPELAALCMERAAEFEQFVKDYVAEEFPTTP